MIWRRQRLGRPGQVCIMWFSSQTTYDIEHYVFLHMCIAQCILYTNHLRVDGCFFRRKWGRRVFSEKNSKSTRVPFWWWFCGRGGWWSRSPIFEKSSYVPLKKYLAPALSPKFFEIMANYLVVMFFGSILRDQLFRIFGFRFYLYVLLLRCTSTKLFGGVKYAI